MNEGEGSEDLGNTSVEAGDAAHAPTAGSLLREARMAAGVHMESIAFSLKVPVVKIDALERDDLSAFPDATFMRALAGSVCRGLRIDPAPVLALMPQSPRHRLAEQGNQPRATFRDPPGNAKQGSWPRGSSFWVSALVLLLLIGIAAVVFIPQGWHIPSWTGNASAPETTGTTVTPQDFAVSTQNQLATKPGLIVSQNEAVASTAGNDSARSDAQPTPTSPVIPAAASDNALTLPLTAKAASPSSLVGSGVAAGVVVAPRLSVAARGETWVQVMDASRKVLLERILKKGESANVNEPGRLSVVIGRADVAQVQVNGNALDVSKNVRDNVARFEVAE